MIELAFVAALLIAAPILIWRESVVRYLYAFGASIAIWFSESEMRAFMRETEKPFEPREIEDAAHEAATHPRRERVDLHA